MNTGQLILRHIAFTGNEDETPWIGFSEQLTFIYGASNTGKSFALEAIDFMLGASVKVLSPIPQREPFDRAWLGLTLPSGRDITLSRRTQGGDFDVQKGLEASFVPEREIQVLRAKHDAKRSDTVSHLLLSELGLSGLKIAKNKSSETENLSFRDLAPFVLVNETAIQARRSPIVSGQRADFKEYSVFRLLLSGRDDSELRPNLTPAQWKRFRQGRAATLEELFSTVEKELAASLTALGGSLPNGEELDARLAEVRETWEKARQSLNSLLEKRRAVVREVTEITARLNAIDSHLGRFSKLDEVYLSDVARLEALEEAGFLLTMGEGRECPLCGAAASAQNATHGLDDVARQREAAIAEIQKIADLRADLQQAVSSLNAERVDVQSELSSATARLEETQAEIRQASQPVSAMEGELRALIARREGLVVHKHLLARRSDLELRMKDSEQEKRPRGETPSFKVPDTALHEFCLTMSEVLKAWRFPGQCSVSFDEKLMDVKIDGKPRIANGKGVRAITHAAFKVALLMYCQRQDLPHPGFLVLDSPLVAYRDPVNTKKGGPLEADERLIAESPVREHFFRHLASLGPSAQVVVLDNIDPPPGIAELAQTELFTGSATNGRRGFF